MILETRKPAAIVKMPPQADKSANIVVKQADKVRPTMYTTRRIAHCGKGIAHMDLPKEAAKIIAVNPSRTALDINRLGSPVMPSVRVLYHPKPEQQNSATAVM